MMIFAEVIFSLQKAPRISRIRLYNAARSFPEKIAKLSQTQQVAILAGK